MQITQCKKSPTLAIMTNLVIVITVFFLSMQVSAQTANFQTKDAAQLAELLEKNRNIEGRFQQITYDEAGIAQQKSEGMFILSQPNRFIWDTELPFPQKIVSNGESITIWDIDLEQASQKSFAKAVGNSPAALLSQPANEVLPHYEVIRFGKGKLTHARFELTPNSDEGLFASLALEFKNNSIHSMKIKDTLGQMTVIDFDELTHHKGVGASRFELDLPVEVDLIVTDQ